MTAHCMARAACIEGEGTVPALRTRDSRPLLSSDKRLAAIGITDPGTLHWNPGRESLVESAVRGREGLLAAGGALVCGTGAFTGRSPDDKFFVRDAATDGGIDWGDVNREMAPESFATLRRRMLDHLQGRELFVQDCDAGADPAHRLPVRVVTEQAWHSLFARNIFLRPSGPSGGDPEWTILHAPGFQADPETDGCRSSTVIAIGFSEKLILIGGTYYAGEIKKSVFTLLNYLLPAGDVMPMHCSANIGPEGSAVFFGLSGTGKTTLSADPGRQLIGDDEHGWSDGGIFNFEGGCYAKVIDLDRNAEPEIHAASHRFGTVLENVAIDPETRLLDLADRRVTENTRSCYPLEFIPNACRDGLGPPPRNIVMLTADAFGVLPPISRMTTEQAMYHFLSGYTAKVAGTERGLGSKPVATFSTCFGAPFMARKPSVYAGLLGKRVAERRVNCWLVNTGWNGRGERMSIAHTRAMVNAALGGALDGVETARHPVFGLHWPTACPDVPPEALDPRTSWQDRDAYDARAAALARDFESNFRRFEPDVSDKVREAAIRAPG